MADAEPGAAVSHVAVAHRSASEEASAGRAAEIYRQLDCAFSPEERHTLAHVKRFMELILGDPDFRQMIRDHRAREAVALYGVDVDPEQLLPLYDSRYMQLTLDDKLEGWPAVKLWKHRIRELLRSRDLMRDDGNTDGASPAFDRWRRGQILRNDSELGQLNNDSIVYPVVAFELSQGCTMGCWFCGISAEKFKGYFPYTPQNAALWRGVLGATRRLLGPAAATGFCYWATDPFDNPDYARFLDDYNVINGAMPQTTSAAPLRNLALTREVMEMQRRNRTVVNRFSITTLKTLRAVHETFTADELLDIELVMQHKEAVTAKALAGDAMRNFEKLKQTGREAKLPHLGESYGTIACVSGFLVNMVERTVRLVSPCRASKRFPRGYKVYAARTFDGVEDFERVCAEMIRGEMRAGPRPGDPIRFRDDLRYEALDDGFALENEFGTTRLEGRPLARGIGERIAAGGHTTRSLSDAMLDEGADFFAVSRAIQDLFDAGVLAEPIDFLPEPVATGTYHA